MVLTCDGVFFAFVGFRKSSAPRFSSVRAHASWRVLVPNKKLLFLYATPVRLRGLFFFLSPDIALDQGLLLNPSGTFTPVPPPVLWLSTLVRFL